MKLYHGSNQIVEEPEIRVTKFNKDFYFGSIARLCKSRRKDGRQDLEQKDMLTYMNTSQIQN